MVLVAVWLTALAPTVSRTATTFVFPDLGAWCESVRADHHGSGHEAQEADAACGYCTLFAQQPALAAMFFVPDVLPVATQVPVALPGIRAGPAAQIIHSPPRGPPSAAHA